MTVQTTELPSNPYDALILEIHNRNVRVGWWTDLATGESTVPTRNRAELLMLVVSEASEACAGWYDDLNDDKLPHLSMFDVELADIAIRLFDMIGAEVALAGSLTEFDYQTLINDEWDSVCDWYHADRQLMRIVNHCSAAMEHLRKGRRFQYQDKLVDALACTFAIAKVHKIDLFDVINQKLEYNANRADHKIENRLKDDGKKF